MLRHLSRLVRGQKLGTRTVYVAVNRPGSTRRRAGAMPHGKSRLELEESDLDQKIKQLREEELKVRQFLKKKREEESQQNIRLTDRVKLNATATNEDISAIEGGLRENVSAKFSSNRVALPASIQALVPSEGRNTLSAFSEPNWRLIAEQIPSSNVPIEDVEKFVGMIPVSNRAQFIGELESFVANHSSQFIADKLMETYAYLAMPQDVERLLEKCPKPTIYSFSHLSKSYFKTKQPEKVFEVLGRLDSAGITANLTIYTSVVQALIQSGKYEKAFSVFDSLKYLSTETLPDTRLYNSMMLAASKTRNVNKVMDLYAEMKDRAIDPLEPDASTYNILVYACARDEKTYLQAWNFFLEARDRGFEPGRESMRALLYLCGNTGEVLIARALIRQMCLRPETYADQFALNCLLLAYVNYNPDMPSLVLGTSTGLRIRDNLLRAAESSSTSQVVGDEHQPPLLPLIETNSSLILAESEALIRFFAERAPQVLRTTHLASNSRFMGSPVIMNHLRVAIKHGKTIEEFRKRFEAHTYFSDSAQEQVIRADQPWDKLERDKDVYRLAISACIKFRELAWARELWEERGRWRRTSSFRSMDQPARNQCDSLFARDLVTLLAECGETNEAIAIVKSSKNLVKWRWQHVEPLVRQLEKIEDQDGIKRVMALVRSGKRHA